MALFLVREVSARWQLYQYLFKLCYYRRYYISSIANFLLEKKTAVYLRIAVAMRL